MNLMTRASRQLPIRRSRGYFGFTLVEMLVVLAIVAIMAALLLSALSKAKEYGRSTVCRNNMRQITLGFLMYAEDNGEVLPWPGGAPDRANTNPNYAADWCAGGQSSITASLSSWSAPGFGMNPECGSVFPYVMSQQRRTYSASFKQPYPTYLCPNSGILGEKQRVNYSANGWLDPGKPFGTGAVPANGVMTTAIVDPSRKVLIVNEDPRRMLNPAFEPGTASSPNAFVQHLDRCNVSFTDGHLEAVQVRTFLRMQGRDADVYFNLGK